MALASANTLAATWQVSSDQDATSCAKAAKGTLRHAVCHADDGDRIEFSKELNIRLASTLELSKDFTVDGAGNRPTIDASALPAFTDAIHVAAGNVSLHNIKVQASAGAGVGASGASTVNISHVLATDNKTGVEAKENAIIEIRNSELDGNKFEGIHVSGSAIVDVHDSTISANKIHGATTRDRAKLNLIDSSVLANANEGFHVTGQSTLSVEGVSIKNNRVAGIAATDEALVSVIDTQLENNAGSNIKANGWGILVVRDSQLTGANTGIELGHKYQVLIERVKFKGNKANQNILAADDQGIKMVIEETELPDHTKDAV